MRFRRLDSSTRTAWAKPHRTPQRDLIDKNTEEIEVVFLDLNLPRDEGGSDLDKDHGYQLLDWIHANLNVRPNVHIRVIIISGEYSDYHLAPLCGSSGWRERPSASGIQSWLDTYRETATLSAEYVSHLHGRAAHF